MTVQDILNKLNEIDDAVNNVESRIDSHGRQYPGHESLWKAIELLYEYRDLLLKTNVDIKEN